jgi:hypothetical protein
MIEQLAMALNTLITNQQLNVKKREDSYVIVSKSQTSPTSIGDDFFAQFQGNSLTTYQSVPVTKIDNDDVFVSHVKRSVTVNGLFVIGGRISQPEIDEDEIVYFDE